MPDNLPPPYGSLYRPTVKACFSDTLTFSGVEQEGDRRLAKVWFCKVGNC